MDDMTQGKYDRDRAKAEAPRVEERDPIMKYFRWDHLPPHLQETSKQFGQLAEWVHANVPRCAERTVALRKLLEGKDAAVRAALP